MKNRFILFSFLFLLSSTYVTAQLEVSADELCSGHQLFSELEKDQTTNDNIQFYTLNNRRYTGTAVKHIEEGNETCNLFVFENGVILKIWGFYSNGKLSREAYFKQGLPHGVCIEYYENGRKASEINYKSGVLHGDSNEWHPDGSVIRESKYNLGNLISEKF